VVVLQALPEQAEPVQAALVVGEVVAVGMG
jgi:hypothetical protein